MKAHTGSYLCKVVATVGPLGYYKAPGTLGSCVGLILMYSLYRVVHTYTLASFLMLLLILFAAYYIIEQASTILTGCDPQEIILDEVIGCCIALFGIVWHWWAVLVCFGLFRFFDISKCLGGAYLEKRCPGPLGIMLDDIYAGLLANMLTRVLVYYIIK